MQIIPAVRNNLWLVAVLAQCVTGCKADNHWTDEALLHDGRTIDVQRTVAYHFAGGELSEAFKQWPDQYEVTATNPDTGATVRWSGEQKFNPILIDFLGKTTYLVAVATSIYADLKQYGCPEIPYVFFRQNEGDRGWTQIVGSEFPKQLLRANLSFSYSSFMEDRKPLTKDDIDAVNRTGERSSGGYRSRVIPTDFASWKADSKDGYRTAHYHDGCRGLVQSN